MTLRFLTLCAVAMLAASPAMALDLHQARAQGLIGEKADGYAAALQPSAAGLVAEVNAKRTQEYARISAQNGQPVAIVGKLAAEQIISKLKPGESYQGSDGSWKKR